MNLTPAVDAGAPLGAMRDALTHRGPDGEGTFRSPDGRVGLVNRRLAVVDRSPAAAMPMRNASGTVWITYNGEIYNAAALRAENLRLAAPRSVRRGTPR